MNRDLLYTGIFLHDLGKLHEMTHDLHVEYTDAGVYAMPHMHQIYVLDLTANFIEVNQYV